MKKKQDLSIENEAQNPRAGSMRKNNFPLKHNPSTTKDWQQLVRELQTYQMELEQQNEELRQTQAEVDSGLQGYTELYDFAPLGYFVLGRDGTILQVNLSGGRLMGRERDTLIGEQLGAFMAVESLPVFNAFLARVINNRDKESIELTLQTTNILPLYVCIEAVTSKNGQKCYAIVVDITEHKHLEDGLRKNEQEFRTLAEHLPDMVARFDRQYRHTYVNPAVITEMGVKPEAILGKSHRQLGNPPEMSDWSESIIRQVFESGQQVDFELNYPIGGEIQYYLSRGIPEFANDGSIVSALFIHRNITKRKQAEAELRQSEETLRVLIDSGPESIFLTDNQGTILVTNQAASRRFNKRIDQMIGLSFYDLLPKDAAETRMGHIKDVVQTGKPLHFEDIHAGRSIDNYYQPVKSNTNQVEKVAILAVDITERKRMVEALRNAHDELERRVVKRTADLEKTNQQLEEKIAELEETRRVLEDSETKYRIVADNTYDWEYWSDPQERFIYNSPSCESITGYTSEDFMNDPALIDHIIHPEDRLLFEKHKQETIDNRFPTNIEFRVIRPDGGVRWIDHFCLPVFDKQSAYLGRRGSNRDITERKRMEEEIRLSATRTEVLVDTAARLSAQLELEAVLKTVCEQAAHSLNTQSACVYLYYDQDDLLKIAADFGFPTDFSQQLQPLLRKVYDGLVRKFGAHAIIHDPRTLDIPLDKPLQQLGICSAMAASMFYNENLVGFISVFTNNEKRQFDNSDLSLLKALASQASQAIANARLFEQVLSGQQRMRKLSQVLLEIQEEERRSLALELHDELGQLLSSTKMSLDILPTLSEPEASQQLERAQKLVGGMVDRVRRMALELRPSLLDDLGLVPALSGLFNNYRHQTGEVVIFEQSGLSNRYPPQLEITVYRIIQEALTNVIRHAGNKHVNVSIWADEGFLNLQVVDQGMGFNPAVIVSERVSTGLSGMRERARLLGGDLVIESSPGGGTALSARLPVTPRFD